MPYNDRYPPEGLKPHSPYSLSELQRARETGAILEGIVERCDAQHTLYVPLGPVQGQMPAPEVTSSKINGAHRDIAILSRVGKPICFTVQSLSFEKNGTPVALLSRRAVQEKAIAFFLETLRPGMILPAKVTHLESFGAFLDIGCGVIALLPVEHISVSRIDHPSARFRVGQTILAVVRTIHSEPPRFTMSHKELLGTWTENASRFSVGETVPGIVRTTKDYGIFVELTPNLSGLTDFRPGIVPGTPVSVYIRSIRPERMKIKLQLIEPLLPSFPPKKISYQITNGQLQRWTYSPPNYVQSPIFTDFSLL